MATKDYSSKQEKMIADYLNWEVVSGSGAAPCVPGDIISPEWLGECKTHVAENDKVQFLSTWWKKIAEEAMIRRRFPVLFTDNGSQELSHTWCIFETYRLLGRKITKLPAPQSTVKSKTNINFSDSKLKEILSTNLKCIDGPIVYIVNMNGQKLVLCDIHTFTELFRR